MNIPTETPEEKELLDQIHRDSQEKEVIELSDYLGLSYETCKHLLDRRNNRNES